MYCPAHRMTTSMLPAASMASQCAAEKEDADQAQLEEKELRRWDEALESRDASRSRSP